MIDRQMFSRRLPRIESLFDNVRNMRNPFIEIILPNGDLVFRKIGTLLTIGADRRRYGIKYYEYDTTQSFSLFGELPTETCCPSWVVEGILALEEDPKKLALLQGKQTNCCMFCRKELTDARSVYFGYGPVCAENWGLPYRMTPEAELEIMKLELQLKVAQIALYESQSEESNNSD